MAAFMPAAKLRLHRPSNDEPHRVPLHAHELQPQALRQEQRRPCDVLHVVAVDGLLLLGGALAIGFTADSISNVFKMRISIWSLCMMHADDALLLPGGIPHLQAAALHL